MKVPTGYHWNTQTPADKFYIRFDEIFKMMHMLPLQGDMVRLWALHMARSIVDVDQHKDIAVADPYGFCENNLKTIAGRKAARRYLSEFLVANKNKSTILLPYFPK